MDREVAAEAGRLLAEAVLRARRTADLRLMYADIEWARACCSPDSTIALSPEDSFDIDDRIALADSCRQEPSPWEEVLISDYVDVIEALRYGGAS